MHFWYISNTFLWHILSSSWAFIWHNWSISWAYRWQCGTLSRPSDMFPRPFDTFLRPSNTFQKTSLHPPQTIWHLPKTIWHMPQTIWHLPETIWYYIQPLTNWKGNILYGQDNNKNMSSKSFNLLTNYTLKQKGGTSILTCSAGLSLPGASSRLKVVL